ncbi:MAG: hypothetical protein EZS28_006503 [Streblomastix strix]|uniref:Uncharacterized protein n=1 Tax=Streblomastix strix TaxID=222440 RepID=A0A5J4WS68_9EUKA|nr:MAG: hypothetical protein EZS28_006503 [Streblomastix strix]
MHLRARPQTGSDSETNRTQRQNTIARNIHTVMEIDMESEGRDINPPPLEAKINQGSFNGQKKYWKDLDIDLKLDKVRLQSPATVSEKQGNEKDQIVAYQNNPRMRYGQDDRDDFRSLGRGQRGGRGDYRGRGYRRNRSDHNRDSRATDSYQNGNNHNLFSVAPWPPVESVPANSSNTVVPDHPQRQIGGPTPHLVRTPDSWQSNKTATLKQQSKQPTPSQEQDHHHQPIAVTPLPINSANNKVFSSNDTQHIDMIELILQTLAHIQLHYQEGWIVELIKKLIEFKIKVPTTGQCQERIPEQEQSENGSEQDQGQLDLNYLPDNPGSEGPSELTQKTRMNEANKDSSKPGPKSSSKNKKGH